MRKAGHHSGGMDSSNQCSWRGERLCQHGDGVWKVVCAFCAVSQLVTRQSGFSYVKNVPQHNLKMRFKVLLIVPHWRAPHQKPSFIWLLCVSLKWRPPKAKAHHPSLLFDGSCLGAPNKGKKSAERKLDGSCLMRTHGGGTAPRSGGASAIPMEREG